MNLLSGHDFSGVKITYLSLTGGKHKTQGTGAFSALFSVWEIVTQ